MRKAVAPMIFGGIIALALILYTISFQLRYTEVGVKLTWKKPTATITAPGLYWKLPWPIQEVKRFDKRIRTYERRTFQAQTADGKPMVITPFINWKIKPDKAREFLVSLGTVKSAEEKLASLLSSACANRVGQTKLSDLLTTSRQKAGKFEELERALRQDVASDMMDADGHDLYGIEIVSVGLKRLQLDEAVTTAAFQAMIAERQKVQQIYRAEGEGRSAAIRVAADSKAKVILAAAEAEAAKTRAEGIEAAASYYSTFARNEPLHNFLRMMESVRKNFSKRTTIFMTDDSPLVRWLASEPKTIAAPVQKAEAGTPAPVAPAAAQAAPGAGGGVAPDGGF